MTLLPQWTKAVKIEEGARDPLGLDRAYDRFGEWLLPGITTITPRARYYSFYLWAMQAARHTDGVQTRQQYVEAMRRREAAFVIANMADRENREEEIIGLIGWRQGRQTWQQGEATGNFSTTFQPVRNPLGGFDQAYGGSLLKLGLWQRTEATHRIDEPTQAGALLAEAYGQSIAKTVYATRLQNQDSLHAADLLEYAQAGGLNYLHPGSAEAQALIDLFFNRPPFETEAGKHRRDALLLGLFATQTVSQIAGNGTDPVKQVNADDVWVEQIGYFRAVRDHTRKAHPCAVPDQLVRANDAHALLQMHRYFALGLEHLLAFVLAEASAASGVTVQQLPDRVDWAVAAQVFSRELTGPSADAFPAWVRCLENEIKREAAGDLVTVSLDQPESECDLVHALKTAEGAQQVGLSLRLLLLLYHRAKRFQTYAPELWADARAVAGDGLWTGEFCEHVERWLSPAITIQDYLAKLLMDFVVLQHNRVRWLKGALTRGWLEQDQSGCVHKVQDYGPRYRVTRLDSAQSILYDLGLIAVGHNIALTRLGESVLQRELGQF